MIFYKSIRVGSRWVRRVGSGLVRSRLVRWVALGRVGSIKLGWVQRVGSGPTGRVGSGLTGLGGLGPMDRVRSKRWVRSGTDNSTKDTQEIQKN